jgi:hypothetical protein
MGKLSHRGGQRISNHKLEIDATKNDGVSILLKSISKAMFIH